MKYEFHAQYALALQDGVTQAAAIDFLAHKRKRSQPPRAWPELVEVEEDWARIGLLAQALATSYKDQARVGARRDPGGYLYWLQHHASTLLIRRRQEMTELGLTAEALPDLSIFPPNAWILHFSFTLRTPYLSRDDTDFYILDNPVKKEWVFKAPYVAPSQWKGALRAAMMQELVGELRVGKLDEPAFTARRLQLHRLFGNETDGAADYLNRSLARAQMPPLADDGDDSTRQPSQSRFEAAVKAVAADFERLLQKKGRRARDIEGFQGRLHFYPTFFDRIGLEVINPHPRNTGAGKQPIYFESVPAGTRGRFDLLYVPFDRIGEDEAETRKQVAEDLTLLAQGLQAMFTLYGFGAKTSSGFGLAEDQVSDGRIQTNVLETVQQANPPEKPAMPEALRLFLEQFPDEDFSLKPKEWRKQRQATNTQRKQYMEARSARSKYQAAEEAYRAALAEWEAQAQEPVQSFVEDGFTSFSQLAGERAKGLAAKLSTGGDA